MLFITLSLSAVVMDFDVLFLNPANHRLFTHTVMLPLMFLLLGLIIKLFTPKAGTMITCCFAINASMGLHLILDMDGPPPMGLFYPLLDRCCLVQPILDWDYNYAHGSFTIREFSIQEWRGQTSGSFGLNLGIMLISLFLFLLIVGKDFLKSKIDKDEGAHAPILHSSKYYHLILLKIFLSLTSLGTHTLNNISHVCAYACQTI